MKIVVETRIEKNFDELTLVVVTQEVEVVNGKIVATSSKREERTPFLKAANLGH